MLAVKEEGISRAGGNEGIEFGNDDADEVADSEAMMSSRNRWRGMRTRRDRMEGGGGRERMGTQFGCCSPLVDSVQLIKALEAACRELDVSAPEPCLSLRVSLPITHSRSHATHLHTPT